MKFEDGEQFELTGNPFKITASVRDVPASVASLSEGLPQFFSVFGSGGSRFWLAISGGRPQRSHALRSGLAGPFLFGTEALLTLWFSRCAFVEDVTVSS